MNRGGRLLHLFGVRPKIVSRVSERLAALENEFAATQANLEEERQARSDLSQQLDASNQSLTEAQQSNAKLVTDNDGLRG